MPSPFPGMDPYLEDPRFWPDVHHELISALRARLNSALRPRYHVRIEDYREPPRPKLSRDAAAWAEALLREKGLRD